MLFLAYLFIYALMLVAVDLNVAWAFFTNAVTFASGILVGLKWGEGFLVIWFPRDTLSPSPFWRFYTKLTQSIEYISLSRQAFGGAAAKGATPPQMLTIAEMAAERGVDVRQLALTLFQKDIAGLSSREASKMISEHLKAIPKKAGA